MPNVNLISKLKAPVFFHLAVAETLGTILLCYGIAVASGHVPAWLPMISDCAVLAPEKYPFRFGMILGATLLEVEILLVYFADKGFSGDKACLVIGSIGTLGFGVVGAVNEEENNTIHSGLDASNTTQLIFIIPLFNYQYNSLL